MTPTIVFTRIHGKTKYDDGARRWLDSLLAFRPVIPHRVAIINRYASNPDGMFDCVTPEHYRYDGGGWDCGSWQFAAKNIETDLLVCFNSSTRIMSAGWLELFMLAAATHGDGLYGPLASFEIIPHIRTPCMVFAPSVIRDYPMTVDNRDDTYRFEVFGWPDGTPNVTQWVRAAGFRTMLVTRDGCYDQPDWRKPDGIFRRGDQSNLIVKDRHCDEYAASTDEVKAQLEKLADGR